MAWEVEVYSTLCGSGLGGQKWTCSQVVKRDKGVGEWSDMVLVFERYWYLQSRAVVYMLLCYFAH